MGLVELDRQRARDQGREVAANVSGDRAPLQALCRGQARVAVHELPGVVDHDARKDCVVAHLLDVPLDHVLRGPALREPNLVSLYAANSIHGEVGLKRVCDVAPVEAFFDLR